ncbi:MAG: metallophosphoesterase [Methylococcaceae bacterium]|nr:metallophosphoesterase [Methylococcaceae bacterium]
MRINYFSDVHLEFGPLIPPDNDAELIIAAGDIGIFRQGVDWLKTLKKPVIYVAGNHEFYTHEYKETLKLLRDECAGSRIHFLENNVFNYKGIRFLGCSLWADLFLEGEEKSAAIGKTLNDFRKIMYEDQPFDQTVFTKLHHISKQWLEKQLAQSYSGKTIVVTHHAPTEWSWDDSTNSLKKMAYCNDLKYLFHEHEIDAWFHGHIHSPGDYRIAGARILSNPRGYMGRKVVDSFDQNRIVEI